MLHRTPFRSSCLFVAPFVLAACFNPSADTDGPGDLIGTFAVDAELDTSSCGAGALGAPTNWSFDIRLSREGAAIYWDTNGELIAGTLEADGRTFSFDTAVAINMRDASSDPTLPPCTMERRDRSDGQLSEDSSSFSGKLRYDFTPTIGSDCADLVNGETPIFAAIPCSMTYLLTAKTTETTP